MRFETAYIAARMRSPAAESYLTVRQRINGHSYSARTLAQRADVSMRFAGENGGYDFAGASVPYGLCATSKRSAAVNSGLRCSHG